MNDLPICDICGRSANDPARQATNRRLKVKLDDDGLWVCSDCKATLVTLPTSLEDEDVPDDRIKKLVGKSAGAICRTLNLPFAPPYQPIIEAASRIAYDEDRFMSAWLFVTQWMDGTTIWQSPDKSARALVTLNGDVQIESRS